MQNLEWYLADLKSTGKNTIETVEKNLTDMFIRLVRIYPCLTLAATPSRCLLSRRPPGVVNELYLCVISTHFNVSGYVCPERSSKSR